MKELKKVLEGDVEINNILDFKFEVETYQKIYMKYNRTIKLRLELRNAKDFDEKKDLSNLIKKMTKK